MDEFNTCTVQLLFYTLPCRAGARTHKLWTDLSSFIKNIHKLVNYIMIYLLYSNCQICVSECCHLNTFIMTMLVDI